MRPVAPHWHFEGQHNGVEHFSLGSTRCAQLDHDLRETMTLTDGTVWRFHAHYCGVVSSSSLWTGAGTFLITTIQNATLSGAFRDSAQLPSKGVPYELDVMAGTGTFRGAEGSCVLSNHLVSIQFGVQQQSGQFACDLYLGHR